MCDVIPVGHTVLEPAKRYRQLRLDCRTGIYVTNTNRSYTNFQGQNQGYAVF